MGRAYRVHAELEELMCERDLKFSECDRQLECFQVSYTDAMASGNGDGDGDDEQGAEVTIDVAESRGGSYYDWGFHRDYWVQFRQWPTLGTSHECEIGLSDAGHSTCWDMEDRVTLDVPFVSSLYFFTSLDAGPAQMASERVFTTSGDKSSGGGVSPCTGSTEWLPYGTNWLWDIWVGTFAYVERLIHCCLSYACPGLFSPGGLQLKRGWCKGMAACDVSGAG